jgi:hypothetical protein
MNHSLPSLRHLGNRWAGAGLACAATLLVLAVSASPCWAAEASPALYLGDQFEGGATARIAGMQVYQWIEYDKLENAKKVLDEALTTKQRLRDGQWVLGELYDGYGEWLKVQGSWDSGLASVRKWRAAEPGNADAALIEAEYWIAYAWFARGYEFSTNVPGHAWKASAERLKMARAVLEESKPYASSNPVWYSSMLSVALLQRWPLKERLALFREAIAKEAYFYPSYYIMSTSLTPRWGGSLAAYHQFVRRAVDATQAEDGATMYARLYWQLSAVEKDKDPFKDLHIRWEDMKRGFEDLMQRHPTSQWNLVGYAYFACRAHDGKTYNALAPKIDLAALRAMPRVFGGIYNLDYCADTLRSRR